jgi:hypothetical protein
MGCLYNGVCSSLVALFLWQQVTNLSAVMTHCGISPSGYGSLSKLDLFWNYLWVYVIWGKYVSLIWSYIWQEVRKCSSVSSSFCVAVCSACLQRPFSIARLCSLSLYIVKESLHFGSVTVVRYSANVYALCRVSHSGQVFCQCVLSV